MAGADIVAFYENKAVDNQGRSLNEILQWPAAQLEYCHDYIQVLFPLPERSAFNDPAPVVDQAVFEAFRARKDLRDSLRTSFEKILWFYGYELHKSVNGSLEVRPGPSFARHSRYWKTPFNHNHLRMTRIIRSLRILGLEEEAVAFYEVISQARTISLNSRMYWQRAATRPLNIAPHVNDAEIDINWCSGPDFLWKFEQERLKPSKSKTGGLDSTQPRG